ncbi:uncharacterized protein LOC129580199 [Sitodiplosis mosellana]|uniref:uncharacterized protein LOC129580199 n=1 Tax=Sitodiplosis mosellana TaxID=263140 RepID=UPI0024444715|nr:uncharacterized protein LOC129580199 [Sitodiplosis mosellana]
MDNRNEAAGRKRQPEGANLPANKRSKPSETVSADVQRASNKTAQKPTKIHYTRLRRRMEEEEEEKLAKLGPDPNLCTTKLTDVNVDCLEHIFKNLSLIDLLNVADSNKQLKPAADLVFASRYGKQSIEINLEFKFVRIFERNQQTAKILWLFCFKLLRCFGHSITKLKIIYGSSQNATLDVKIDRYVSKYCSKSLVEIELKHCASRTLNDLKKPFSSVESLYFVSCELGSKLSELNKWFPKVQRLEFLGANELSDCNDIAVNFPDLQHLSLYLPDVEKNRLNQKHFAELLRLNPNLQKLYIYGHIDAKHLQSFSKHLQHLESLEIHPFGYFSNAKNGTAHFPNVRKLKLRGWARRFPMTFDKLEELIVISIVMDQTLANFISKHKTLTKLNYAGNKYGEPGALLKITLPALDEVDFGYCAFPIDEVITFMKKCTSLKKLTLRFCDEKDYQTVQNRLGNKWRETEKEYYTTTMERQLTS